MKVRCSCSVKIKNGEEYMEYIVAKDGRIRIKSRGRMLLEDLYPGMDGSEVHPIRVTVTEQKILWELSEGRASAYISLFLQSEDKC